MTIKQFLSQIKDPLIKANAFRNTKSEHYESGENNENLTLANLFVWATTPEGYYYWDNLCKKFINNPTDYLMEMEITQKLTKSGLPDKRYKIKDTPVEVEKVVQIFKPEIKFVSELSLTDKYSNNFSISLSINISRLSTVSLNLGRTQCSCSTMQLFNLHNLMEWLLHEQYQKEIREELKRIFEEIKTFYTCNFLLCSNNQLFPIVNEFFESLAIHKIGPIINRNTNNTINIWFI